jgi:hypothetical protein
MERTTSHTEPYMKLRGEQHFETDNGVSTAPALLVLKGNGKCTNASGPRAGSRGEKCV